MSDIVLRGTVAAQVRIRGLAETVKQRLSEQDGQDTVEYIGVLVLVATIVALVAAFLPNVTSVLSGDVSKMIKDIFNGTNPTGGNGGGTSATTPTG